MAGPSSSPSQAEGDGGIQGDGDGTREGGSGGGGLVAGQVMMANTPAAESRRGDPRGGPLGLGRKPWEVMAIIRPRVGHRRPEPMVLPEDSIATARAFGGYALIVTPFHVIVYASALASALPVSVEGVLFHPELSDLADEAWESGEDITRTYSLDSLGPLHDVVVQAAVLDQRWVLLVLVDRTEAVQLEKVRRDFISNMGHELRTPITAVGLIAQALESASDSPDAVAHFAARLAGVAERLERLTEDMMALAFVQDGGEAERFARVEVDRVVERAANHLETPAENRGIELHLGKRTHGVVWGDRDALVTAVENLVSNAIQYSPAGSRVTLMARVDQADGEAIISVIDQGIGIDPASQERIFERFYRTDEARSARAGGTGLGLAIVKHTAAAHGGSISVVSQPGAGSTFALRLPLATGREEAAARYKDKETAKKA